MNFLVLRILTHSELGMFHEYRRQGKEGSKQRAINFDWDVVDRVFPAAKDSDRIEIDLRYQTDRGVQLKRQWLKRQEKNWRLEGNCPTDKFYGFVDPGCLFAMEVGSGSSPATGSWAVFPANDEVTLAVLAEGESGGLARSAMISLHGQEGSRVRTLLATARPDLFTPCAPPPVEAAPATTVNGTTGKALPPNPRRLVRILAAVGHTLPSAVADIVDNAISANATAVSITFGRPDEGNGRWMSITDDGDGMTADRLDEAMRIGSDADYESNSLGKYGYGLKGASWSQADIFTVVSKTGGGGPSWLTWDTNEMNDWTPKSDPLEEWEQRATAFGVKGTSVLWKHMRPPQTMPAVRGLDPHTAEITELERHLALVFHRFLEGKAAGRRKLTIRINGRPVEPNNPVGHPLTAAYVAKPINVPLPGGRGLARVRAQAYLLPSEDELTNHHAAEGSEAVRRSHDLIGLHGKRNDTQGLFIYRNDRLIKWGGWHQMWATNDEKTKLARVVVDFDSALDDPFAINISKQIVQLPQVLQVELKQLADVARRDSQKKYRRTAPLVITGGRTSVGGPAAPAGPLPGHGSGGGGAHPPSGGPGMVPLPGAGGGAAAPGGAPAVPAPRVVVRPVSTTKFIWKVTSSLTGAREVQVSDLDPNLSALVRQLGRDQQGLAHLAEFLISLDRLEIQKSLMDQDDD
jgi:hypothetical protein